MVEYLFWLSASLVFYGTIGYPALIWLLGRIAPKPVRKQAIFPTVTCVIAARNEEHTIGAKLDNLLSSDYPADRLDIIVVSDGSTDNTAAIVEQYLSVSSRLTPHASMTPHPSPLTPHALRDTTSRVTLLTIPTHHGKAHALNMGIAAAQGEIILFADARQRFAPDAIRLLVRSFADPTVGAVSGELMLDSADRDSTGSGLGLYWRFEKILRKAESHTGSTIGCTGAIYAIRCNLFRPLPDGTILDDVLIPLQILCGGHRVVFEEEAKAYDRLSPSVGDEFARKMRTLAGNAQLARLCPSLLNPLRGRVTWRFMSHRLLPRVLMPYCLIVWLLSSMLLNGALYRGALVLQLVVYGAGLLGVIQGPRAIRPLRLPATFLMLNVAGVVGSLRYLCLRQDRDLWRGRYTAGVPREKRVT